MKKQNTAQIFKDFQDKAKIRQGKLRLDMKKFIRNSTIEAENKMRDRENIELKKMEQELESPKDKKGEENTAKFSFSRKL